MEVEARTHLAIDRRWSGAVIALAEGVARVRLETRDEMVADGRGLVHGGFVFCAADHAAMLAVNEPNVVLAASEMSFVAPLRVGDVVEATGRVISTDGRRHTVEVEVERIEASGPTVVARGTFHCAVTRSHVLGEADPGGEGA